MNTPSKCRACGSSDLIWFILRNTGGAQGEPLRMPEIAYDFILGCKGCSETLRVLRAEDVVEYLTRLRTLPAQQGEEVEQQPVGEMISNDGDIYWADRHPPMGTKLYAAPIAQTAQSEVQRLRVALEHCSDVMKDPWKHGEGCISRAIYMADAALANSTGQEV